MTSIVIMHRIKGCMEVSRFHNALFLFVAAYFCFGTVANYIHSITDTISTPQSLQYVLLLFVITFLGFVTYSLIRLRVTLSDWGFGSHRVSNWFAVIIAVVYLVKAVQGSFVLPNDWGEFSMRIIGLSMEELAYRVISINFFLMLFSGLKNRALCAIVASSILFVIPHIPKYDISVLFMIFALALVLGFIYYKLRNIMIPLFLHALTSISVLGSAVVLVGFFAVVALDRLVISRLQNGSPGLWAGVDND